ncbi:hypothetical protein MRB53_023767 [Persea americana]|uniref:Uncharacterized protein n=1 Tax=Persea americana TaxID=3435 RepID=A0ACC2LAD5_PERAE|nr:hypothetical protein MRB53_023767 [Persea americana]
MGYEVLGSSGDAFVFDGDLGNLGGREEGGNVGGDPWLGGGELEGGDVVVGDGDRDVGVEGRDNGGVGVKELDVGDGGTKLIAGN